MFKFKKKRMKKAATKKAVKVLSVVAWEFYSQEEDVNYAI